MKLSSLRKEWNILRRGIGFYLLLSLAGLLALWFSLRSFATLGFLDRSSFFSIYSLLLYLILPLTYLRGWGWERSRGRDLYYLSLPIKDSTLVLQSLFSDVLSYLWYLILPLALGVWYYLFQDFQPGILFLTLLGLGIQGLWILCFIGFLSLWITRSFLLLLSLWIGEFLLYFLMSLTPWDLGWLFSGQLMGGTISIQILLALLFFFLQVWSMDRSRRP